MERVLCPLSSIPIHSGLLARTIFRTAVRRKSWGILPPRPASWQARRQETAGCAGRGDGTRRGSQGSGQDGLAIGFLACRGAAQAGTSPFQCS
jgi:hypothetical protein